MPPHKKGGFYSENPYKIRVVAICVDTLPPVLAFLYRYAIMKITKIRKDR